MEHIFEIKHKSGKKEYLAQNFFLSSDRDAKRSKLKPLRELYRSGALEISCGCTSPKVEMLIAYREDTNTYSIKSFPKKADLHNASCFYSSDNGDNSLATDTSYEQGYVEKDGKTEVRLDSHDFQTEKNRNLQTTEVNVSNPANSKQSKSSVSRRKSSVFALTRRLVTEAWNDSIRYSKGDKYPSNDKILVYDRLNNQVVKKYTIKKNSLKDLFFAGESTGRVYKIEDAHNFSTAAFSIILLEDADLISNSDFVELEVRHPRKKDTRKILVSHTLYKNALTAISNIPAPYFVGGFLTNRGYEKPPEFISFSLVPISDYGAPIESSYERALFNQLSAEKRKLYDR